MIYYSIFLKKKKWIEAKTQDENVEHQGTYYSLNSVLTDKLVG